MYTIITMKTLMKRLRKSAVESNPALARDFPERLSELEVELRLHPARKVVERPLKTINDLAESAIEGDKVVQFSLGKKRYAAGHSDVTYSGSNHARGVRHIRFYESGKPVLDIEGDFEDQQFGTNFRFQNMDLYIPGEWEADFLKLTDTLRQHTAKRKATFKKKRDAERDRLHRRR
jgi:hypothetical protein